MTIFLSGHSFSIEQVASYMRGDFSFCNCHDWADENSSYKRIWCANSDNYRLLLEFNQQGTVQLAQNYLYLESQNKILKCQFTSLQQEHLVIKNELIQQKSKIESFKAQNQILTEKMRLVEEENQRLKNALKETGHPLMIQGKLIEVFQNESQQKYSIQKLQEKIKKVEQQLNMTNEQNPKQLKETVREPNKDEVARMFQRIRQQLNRDNHFSKNC